MWQGGTESRWGGAGARRAAGCLVAIPFTLGAWLASPSVAAADDEGLQAAARKFELRIERRGVPQGQRVLRATEGERVELRIARRSQYPLAALMVAYTMVSLWILAQPIVETGR